MRRRNFIIGLGGAGVAWPLLARSQQGGTPVIGYMSGRSPDEAHYLVAAFEDGLRESGFTVGQNAAIEFRWAQGQYDRLPALADDRVARRVSLIMASGAVQAIAAAKAATSAIPIIFVTGDDPIRLGLVASLNRPGGNVTGISALTQAMEVTGISALTQAMETKRLEILNQLAPKSTPIAMLAGKSNPSASLQLQLVDGAARALGRQVDILYVANAAEIDHAFSILMQHGDGALGFIADPFMNSHRDQLIALTIRYKLASLFYSREQVAAGGLMSYGADFADSFHQAGIYAARVLQGEKPAELPVLQPTKFEFIINLKTAKTTGIVIPPTLLAIADEVIE